MLARLPIGTALMSIGGFVLVYSGVHLFFNREAEFQPDGMHHIDVTRDQIEALSPVLMNYIVHLQLGVSAFLTASGIAVIALAWFGARQGLFWAWAGSAIIMAVCTVITIAAHAPLGFPSFGHFAVIYGAAAIFALGAAMSVRFLR